MRAAQFALVPQRDSTEFVRRCSIAKKVPGGAFVMEIRRKLALLLAVAVWTVALMIPALMLAPDGDDPLAPIGPLASLALPPPVEEPWMLPLRHEASAALSELQAASANHP
jgi:hypothetical protein